MKRLKPVPLSLLMILSLCFIFTCWQGIADPLTPKQKARIILKPEMYDVFYGKADRVYLNGFWKFRQEVNVLKQTGNELSALKNNANPTSDAGLEHGYYKPESDVSAWGEGAVVRWRPVLRGSDRDGSSSGGGFQALALGAMERQKGI